MERETNSMHGLKWGLIISVVYCLFIFLRYKLGATNPIYFAGFAILGYIIVLILLFITGNTRKKALGGYIELKDAFQTMFVAVVIFEFVYAIFNFLYLKFIDPNFFETFRTSTEEWMLKNGMAQSDIDSKLENMDVDSAKKMSGASLIVSYLSNLAVSGVFALIIALIIRKKRDPFQTEQETPLQSQ
jgi:hypothetical protein